MPSRTPLNGLNLLLAMLAFAIAIAIAYYCVDKAIPASAQVEVIPCFEVEVRTYDGMCVPLDNLYPNAIATWYLVHDLRDNLVYTQYSQCVNHQVILASDGCLESMVPVDTQ